MTQASPTKPVVTDDALAGITSFDDALALVNDVFGDSIAVAADVLGTGFGVADEKSAYVGIPFIVLKASYNIGDQVDEVTGEVTSSRFWSLVVVTKDGRKVIINDGGTGIAAQMDELASRHPEILTVTSVASSDPENPNGKYVADLLQPLMVAKGLRVSNYVHPQHGPATTYYLDTSAVA